MAIAVSFRRRLRQIEPEARASWPRGSPRRIEPYWTGPTGMGEEEYVDPRGHPHAAGSAARVSAVAVQRPLDVGRALDASLAVYRRHFVAIVAAMAVAVVPLELLTLRRGRGA